MLTMDVLRQCRLSSYSLRNASDDWPPHANARKRSSLRAISVGVAVNGARCIMILSRVDTLTFQSPLSSASAQTSVAGSVARQSKSRGPAGTPCTGTRSATGSDATTCSVLCAISSTVTSCAKRSYVTAYEYGRFSDAANTCTPSGAACTFVYNAGLPTRFTAPLLTSTTASCELP